MIRFGKYRRKLWKEGKNMDEMWKDTIAGISLDQQGLGSTTKLGERQ